MRPEMCWLLGLSYAIASEALQGRRHDLPVSEIVTMAQEQAVHALLAWMARDAKPVAADTLTRATAQLRADVAARVRHAAAFYLPTAERAHRTRLVNELSDALALALLALDVRATPLPQPSEPCTAPPRATRLIELEA